MVLWLLLLFLVLVVVLVVLELERYNREMTTLLSSIVMFCRTWRGMAGGGWLAGWLMWNIHTTLLPLMVSEWTITGVAESSIQV